MIIPLGNRILVKKIDNEGEVKTNSGLIVGKENKGKTKIAQVIVKSESTDDEANILNDKIKVGDKILIDQYTGVEVKEKEEEYLVIRLIDILGIVK